MCSEGGTVAGSLADNQRHPNPPLPTRCSRLRSLDVCLSHPGFESPPYMLPLPLVALPEGLTYLHFTTVPPVQASLPAGDYLRCLRHLALGPLSALRITPLLPFMPDVSPGG